MLDRNENIIYVGKANNIKIRVASYLRPSTARTAAMVQQVARVDFLVTETEDEALILEAKLVRNLQPKYNVLLKDDKSYPFLAIDMCHDFPRMYKIRSRQQTKELKFFGPFTSASAVYQAMIVIQKICLLRPCTNSFFKARTRPCIEYQIGRCSAPCVGLVSKEDYSSQVQQALHILSGGTTGVIASLRAAMEKSSADEQYDTAAILRDRIFALEKLSNIGDTRLEEGSDYIGLFNDGNTCCVQMFRTGNGGVNYFLEGTEDLSDSELLSIFITNHYLIRDFEPLDKIIVGMSLEDKAAIETAIKKKYNKKALISGEVNSAIKSLNHSAELALYSKLKIHHEMDKIFIDIESLFRINQSINRIEIIDNSHTSGGLPVSVVVVAGRNGFIKSQYRIYNIKQAQDSDDYGMLQEVLTRRFNGPIVPPDLLLIDGGRGHLTVALETLRHLDIRCVCMAKGKERRAGKEKFYMAESKMFRIQNNDKVLRYLQRLRDEAHRFAISSHRKRRMRSFVAKTIDLR